jgi:hypothetical protein
MKKLLADQSIDCVNPLLQTRTKQSYGHLDLGVFDIVNLLLVDQRVGPLCYAQPSHSCGLEKYEHTYEGL